MCGNGSLTAIDGIVVGGIVPALIGLSILILYLRRRTNGKACAIAYAAICYAYWALNLTSGIPAAFNEAAGVWFVATPIVLPLAGIFLTWWIARLCRRWQRRRTSTLRGFAVFTKKDGNQLRAQAERWPRIVVNAEAIDANNEF